ncbi:MAG: ABC transporter permease [Thermodesulfobacteriota bacterium]
MELLKLVIRNVFRHRLRACLTILGVAMAVLAFGMLRTLVDAWYSGADAAAANRLVTRHRVSLVHMLPVAYRAKILQIQGVTEAGYGIWYGGIYKDKKNFFAQIALNGTRYLNVYPEFLLTEPEKKAFDTERNACVAGRRLAERFGWKIGDVIPLEGTIFPGRIELVLRGIYRGGRRGTDDTALFFRWDYLNELIKKSFPEMADKAGWFLIQIKDSARAAEISEEIDGLFRNSLAETLTETEKAFNLGFIAMMGALIAAIKVVSVVVIGVILVILANTMAMTARERSREYAVFKTVGFKTGTLLLLIAGESVAIAAFGGLMGIGLAFPCAAVFREMLSHFLPVFDVSRVTIGMMLGVSLVVGVLAALPPWVRISRMGIAEGLRHIG